MFNPIITKAFQALITNCIVGGMLISNPANAAIIYDQPGSTLPGFNSDGRGIYDDFELASDFILTRYEWTGGTVSFSDPPIDAPLFLWGGIGKDDSSGQPEDIAITAFTGPTAVAMSSSSTDGRTVNVYRYSVDLSSPVTLQGGQRYWLGINGSFPSIPSGSDALQWHWAFGAGGNNQALLYEGAIPRTPLASDFSFTLIGSTIPTSVPEPGMLLLLGIGLAAFHLNRRSSSLVGKRE
jgi:hypothetical protein